MKAPTRHSLKFPPPSNNIKFSTKSWAHGLVEDTERMGLWRTCQIETPASLESSKDLMQSLWWCCNKTEKKSTCVSVSFLLLWCNTMIESYLEEEGFVWLAIPGYSPYRREVRMTRACITSQLRTERSKSTPDSHLLDLSLIFPLLYGSGTPAKGVVLPKVGCVSPHQSTKTTF